MSSGDQQKLPTENIKDHNERPSVSLEMVAMIVSRIYGLVPNTVKELDSYDDRNFHIKVSLEHTNPCIEDICSHGYVLKVINSLESKSSHVEAEFAAQHQLAEHNINSPLVAPSCDGQMYQLIHLSDYAQTTATDEDHTNTHSSSDPGPSNQIRLMKFVPGVPFNTVPYTPHLLINAGAFLAKIHDALQDFTNPNLTEGHPLWALNKVSLARPFLTAVTDITKRNLAEEVINTCHDILTNNSHLPRGVIHGDFSDTNILVTPSSTKPGDHDVTGVIDFEHLAHSFYIYDLAVSIMYISVESSNIAPLLVGGYVLSGYLQQRHLSEAEWHLLKDCICTRYAQSLVIGAYHSQCEPDNEYMSRTSVRGWEQLTELWNTPKEQLYGMWCDVIRDCGTDVKLPY